MSRARRAAVAVAGLALGALAPRAASACAVCGVGGDSHVFLWSTVFLSLLPLGLLAGGVWFLRRAAKDRLADEFQDRDAPRQP